MKRRLGLVGVVCVVAMAGIGALASGATQRFTVTSSLDGKKTLPTRMHWLAYPHGNPGQVARIDFLIDGKLIWSENKAPYTFGGDDTGRNSGFLITTWLKPGMHRFSLRAVDKTGTQATSVVAAAVSAAPAAPAALGGTWTRTVTAADLKKGDSDGPPAGAWKLIFDHVGAWHLDPLGSGAVNQYLVAANMIHVYAPIWMAPHGISRFGHTGLGGNDCTAAGPFGSYTWSVDGDTLTLTAAKEPCGNRRAIWEGTWTRG